MNQEYYTLNNELAKAKPAEAKVQVSGAIPPIFIDGVFKSNIDKVPFMTEQQLTELIKSSFDEIISDILYENCIYNGFFKDDKFVGAFFRVVSTLGSLNGFKNTAGMIKTACNKLAYDYFTFDGNDGKLRPIYMAIVKVVDQKDIMNLMALGLDELTACNLAFCRYGSFKEQVNVKRLNFSICFRDAELMTEQMIVWIYEKLFDNITDLFIGTMLEVYNPEEFEDFGNNFMEVYGAIGLAVLTILNNMTSTNIYRVLKTYESTWRNEHKCSPTRFSLRTLSNDYSRIVKVVEALAMENIFIP